MSTVKAVILVGGEGTRLRPLTSNTPKPMVPILNRPFLEHVITYLSRHGINDIILALCYLPDRIRSYFQDGNEFGVRLTYIVEDSPLGTAGAVKNVQKYLDGTFVVLNGDIYTDLDLTAMLDFHRDKKAEASIALTAVDDPTIYGVVETDNQDRVQRFIEKPGWDSVTTNMINAGTYILEPAVLSHVPINTYNMFEHNLFPLLLEMNRPIYGYHTHSYWIDIGTPEKYHLLNSDILMGKTDNTRLGRQIDNRPSIGSGCDIHSSVSIKGPSLIGENCIIGSNVEIISPSVIGPGCIIGNNSRIEQAVLWQNTRVYKKVTIIDSVVGNNCCIEDNAWIVDKVVLGDNVRISNDVKLEHGIKIEPGHTI